MTLPRPPLGAADGSDEGLALDGELGAGEEGSAVGIALADAGALDGVGDGELDGAPDGSALGLAAGELDGSPGHE